MEQQPTPEATVSDEAAGTLHTASGVEDAPKAEESVKYSTYKRVVSSEKNWKAKAEELQAQIEAQNNAALAEQGKYKELYENAQEANKALQTQIAKEQQDRQDFMKLRAMVGAIDGKVDAKYYGLMPIDKVLVDPETGEIDQMSVTKAVETFRQEHGILIQGTKPAQMPAQAPQYVQGGRSFSELSAKEKAQDVGERLRNLKGHIY